MLLSLGLIIAVAWLSWSNGANDNFKGVATLYGSGTTTYRRALGWATAATVLGSLTSVLLAASLVKAFSGKGLVPDDLLGPPLLLAVGLAGAVTILLATMIGMPTSTTHALTGALVGVALVGAGPGGVDWHVLATKFAQPLLLSPVLAILAAAVVYPLGHRLRLALGIQRTSCVCAGEAPEPIGPGIDPAAVPTKPAVIDVSLGDVASCTEYYAGRMLMIEAQKAIDLLHYLSAGAVCFARSVNDTPKIAALLLAATATGAERHLGQAGALLLVAIAMAAGGLVQSRKVAETMSKRITRLNAGQGLSANLVTSLLVIVASRVGVPVSTTHVSCGAIFGIGLATGERDNRTILQILVAWITTLPCGLVLGALAYLVTRTLG